MSAKFMNPDVLKKLASEFNKVLEAEGLHAYEIEKISVTPKRDAIEADHGECETGWHLECNPFTGLCRCVKNEAF